MPLSTPPAPLEEDINVDVFGMDGTFGALVLLMTPLSLRLTLCRTCLSMRDLRIVTFLKA